MSFKKFSLFFFAFFSLVLTTTPKAEAISYEIDGAHSNAVFKVQHLGISKVSGQFAKITGSVDYDDFFTDPERAQKAKTSAVIAIASINTGIERRDEHLKSKDFFDVDKYPDMKFESEEVKVTGEKTFDIIGNLTLHGVTKPVTLKAKYNGEAKDPFSGTRKIAFTADTKISRSDFGLTWNKDLESGGFLVGEEVEIFLEVEADEKPEG